MSGTNQANNNGSPPRGGGNDGSTASQPNPSGSGQFVQHPWAAGSAPSMAMAQPIQQPYMMNMSMASQPMGQAMMAPPPQAMMGAQASWNQAYPAVAPVPVAAQAPMPIPNQQAQSAASAPIPNQGVAYTNQIQNGWTQHSEQQAQGTMPNQGVAYANLVHNGWPQYAQTQPMPVGAMPNQGNMAQQAQQGVQNAPMPGGAMSNQGNMASNQTNGWPNQVMMASQQAQPTPYQVNNGYFTYAAYPYGMQSMCPQYQMQYVQDPAAASTQAMMQAQGGANQTSHATSPGNMPITFQAQVNVVHAPMPHQGGQTITQHDASAPNLQIQQPPMYQAQLIGAQVPMARGTSAAVMPHGGVIVNQGSVKTDDSPTSPPVKRPQYPKTTWEKRYRQLIAYYQLNGHCDVPQRFPDNIELGRWVKDQRTNRKKGSMSQDRIARLDRIGFSWVLKNNDEFWNERYAELVEFRNVRGHCNVPADKENLQLARWTERQRRMKKDGKINKQKIAKMDELGFYWGPNEEED